MTRDTIVLVCTCPLVTGASPPEAPDLDPLGGVVAETAPAPDLILRLAITVRGRRSCEEDVVPRGGRPLVRPAPPGPGMGIHRREAGGRRPGGSVIQAELDQADRESPDQARPSSSTGPGRTTRRRDMKSGKPGGITSARGRIRVTGVPTSPGLCRSR